MSLRIEDNKQLFQELLIPLGLAFVIGFGFVTLTNAAGYPMALLTVCGIPILFCVLWGLSALPFKLKILFGQLRWWHLLWFFVFLSGLVFRAFDAQTARGSPLDFWALYRIALMGTVAAILLGRLATRQTHWIGSLFQGRIGLLAGYALVSIASSLWSVYPTWTLYKSIEYMIDVVLIAAIISSIRNSYQFKSLFDITWMLSGILVVFIWIGVFVWPDQAIISKGFLGRQITGVLPIVSANSVGQWGAVLGVVALTRLLFSTASKRFYIVIFLLGITTLIFSQSRSPLVGFFVGALLVFWATKRIGLLTFLILCALGILSFTSFADIFMQFFMRGQGAEAFASLTGRVLWWQAGWEVLEERPLVGYGAYAGARFAVLAHIGYENTYAIHNTWLEILIGTGILGCFFIVACFAKTWTALVRDVIPVMNNGLGHQLQVEAMGVFAVLSVRSFFSSSALIWHPPLIFLLVLGYAEFLHIQRKSLMYKRHPHSRNKTVYGENVTRMNIDILEPKDEPYRKVLGERLS